MSEEQRRQLQQQLWNIANTLRGKMSADDFRDYILGFIFYKYLSEKIANFANDQLEGEELTFETLDERSAEGKKYLEAIEEAKRTKCTGMMWQVLDWNQPAIDFYNTLGVKMDAGWLNVHLDL